MKKLMKRHGRAKTTTTDGLRSYKAASHNHFNQDRHVISRETYKAQRSAGLAEWQTLAG